MTPVFNNPDQNCAEGSAEAGSGEKFLVYDSNGQCLLLLSQLIFDQPRGGGSRGSARAGWHHLPSPGGVGRGAVPA